MIESRRELKRKLRLLDDALEHDDAECTGKLPREADPEQESSPKVAGFLDIYGEDVCSPARLTFAL
jgi:hypothetical protein